MNEFYTYDYKFKGAKCESITNLRVQSVNYLEKNIGPKIEYLQSWRAFPYILFEGFSPTWLSSYHMYLLHLKLYISLAEVK